MQRLTTVFLMFLACAVAAPANAHGSHADAVADAPIAATPVVLEGTVQSVTVDDESTHATRDYRVLVTPDGTVRLLHGNAAQSLMAGAQYSIRGTANGKYVDTESATLTATSATTRSAAATDAFAITGTLRMGHMDYTDRPSEYFFAVFTTDGHQRMLPGTELFDALQNSMEVSAYGTVARSGAYIVEHIVIHRHPAAVAATDMQAKAAATHTLFIAPVKFPTNSAPPLTYPAEAFSTATLNTAVFGAAPIKSVVEYYKEVSYGQQTLTGITAKIAATKTTPDQWLKAAQQPAVDKDGHALCDIDFIASQGQAAAQAAGYTNANVTPGYATPGSTASMNHVVYVFSSAGFNCGWSGLAYIGYGLAFVKQTTNLLVIGHELGHTFGLYHAGSLSCGTNPIGGTCSAAEYGDPFDVMGNSNAMHFNAFQKQNLKWITDTTVKTHAGGSTTYALNPLETSGGTSYAVRIPAGPNRTYWLEYRQPLGFDSGISVANANGALVRVARPLEKICDGCVSYSNDTELLDMTTATVTFTDAALVPGARFVDAYYGVIVDVLSRTASELDVKVTSLAKTPNPDFDASATTDLVWNNTANGQTSIWLMNGLTPSSNVPIRTDPNKSVTHTGDLNGDGKTDLIWRTTGGTTSAWLMNGATVTASADLLADPNWSVQFVADFDGDGKKDILWRNSATGAITMWLMNGLTMKSWAPLYSDPNWRVTHVGDFNGDGKADLIWYNATSGVTSIWLMNGLSAISTQVLLGSPTWRVTHVGDFDGDGKSDLVWNDPVGGGTSVWLMNGTGYTSFKVILGDPNYRVTQIGDFDGDGKDDLLWRSDAAGATTIWLMNGTSTKANATALIDTNWSVTHVADTDGDGKSDLVWKNSSTGATSLWLMNGTASRTFAIINGVSTMSVAPPQPQ